MDVYLYLYFRSLPFYRTLGIGNIYNKFIICYFQMMEWLQDIVSLCGQRCSVINIGQSYEGRKLPVVKVGDQQLIIIIIIILFIMVKTLCSTSQQPVKQDSCSFHHFASQPSVVVLFPLPRPHSGTHCRWMFSHPLHFRSSASV